MLNSELKTALFFPFVNLLLMFHRSAAVWCSGVFLIECSQFLRDDIIAGFDKGGRYHMINSDTWATRGISPPSGRRNDSFCFREKHQRCGILVGDHTKKIKEPQSGETFRQNNIYIRKTIYIITKTAFEKPMNRLKDIPFNYIPRINSWAAFIAFIWFTNNIRFLNNFLFG